MLINGERALAYIVECGKVSAIDGADNIELAEVGGWKVIVKKNEVSEGDKCVFFEIDSKLPERSWSEFLRPKNFKVKTMKINKFNVISQGLLLPLSVFPELNGNEDVNTDVTEILGVSYYVSEDNHRKKSDPDLKYKAMAARHKKLFRTRLFRWMMRHKLGKEILFVIFGRGTDKGIEYPSFVKKTDEERVENQPWRVGDGNTYIITEKLDGTSCTYAARRRKCGYEFFVCSRNVRIANENQNTYFDHNIYWDLAFKYNIEQKLADYLKYNRDVEWVCLQGEGVGSVQGNPLQLKEDDLYVFNMIDSKVGRYGSLEGREIVERWDMKWVPIISIGKTQNTMEELKEAADGVSALNGSVLREGLVYRSIDGTDSFKNVSRKYLLSKGKKAQQMLRHEQ